MASEECYMKGEENNVGKRAIYAKERNGGRFEFSFNHKITSCNQTEKRDPSSLIEDRNILEYL